MSHAGRRQAFTLIELMIAVLLIGLLAGIAVPNFLKARAAAQKKACIGNLRTIDVAKQIWATDNRKATTVTATAANLAPYFRAGKMPTCPAGGTYNIRQVGTLPTCNLGSKAGHRM